MVNQLLSINCLLIKLCKIIKEKYQNDQTSNEIISKTKKEKVLVVERPELLESITSKIYKFIDCSYIEVELDQDSYLTHEDGISITTFKKLGSNNEKHAYFQPNLYKQWGYQDLEECKEIVTNLDGTKKISTLKIDVPAERVKITVSIDEDLEVQHLKNEEDKKKVVLKIHVRGVYEYKANVSVLNSIMGLLGLLIGQTMKD